MRSKYYTFSRYTNQRIIDLANKHKRFLRRLSFTKSFVVALFVVGIIVTFLGVKFFTTHAGTSHGVELIKELPHVTSSSNPEKFIESGGKLFFVAGDAIHGRELRVSNGQEGDAVLVKDINVGSGGTDFSSFLDVNGVLYFAANDFVSGWELWKSDGTEAGTVMVKDIEVGGGGANPNYFASMGGILYFQATTGSDGTELWKSDGTEAGTVMVKNDVDAVYPQTIVAGDSVLYFQGYGTTTGAELWKTDGTEAGTVIVKDINPGVSDSYPANIGTFTVVGGVVYFMADDGVHGYELWKSDGTEAGTVMVKDINPGSASSNPQYFVLNNSTVYFAADDGAGSGSVLFQTDGTEVGTTVVSNKASAQYLASFNNEIYFAGYSSSTNIELWKSDGTDAGTTLVKDINVGGGMSYPGETYPGNKKHFVSFNGALYFPANDGFSGVTLWKTDGTEVGTVQIEKTSMYGDFTVFNSVLYFNSGDNVSGAEPWKSDGTESGTGMLQDINIEIKGNELDVVATYEMQGLIVFLAKNNVGLHTLWKSDGTSAGTAKIHEFYDYSGSVPKIVVNGSRLFFVADDGFGHSEELWVSDGTKKGTKMVKDINISGSASIKDLTVFNDVLYFSADNSEGVELWKSDGTEVGTLKVSGDLDAYTIDHLTKVGNALYFSISTSMETIELWKSDGTEVGTTKVKEVAPTGHYPEYSYFTQAGSVVFFRASYDVGSVSGYPLWKTDGTEAGTVMVKDVDTGHHITLDGVLYFMANNAESAELWKSDGTEAGTVMVKSFDGGNYVDFHEFVVFGSRLYFRFGTELWKSDGTEAGTLSVRWYSNLSLLLRGGVLYLDVFDGGRKLYVVPSPDALPVLLKTFPSEGFPAIDLVSDGGDILYFAANDDSLSKGLELWRTDGSALGTILEHDIVNGIGSSYPHSFLEYNGTMFFATGNESSGNSLWKINPIAGATFTLDYASDSNGSLTGNLSQTVLYRENGTSVTAVPNEGYVFLKWSDGVTQNPRTDLTVNRNITVTALFETPRIKPSLLKDINIGSNDSYPGTFTTKGGILYFSANDGIHGTELWKSDGTEAGTVMVKDIFAGAGESYPNYFATTSEYVYFQAYDGVHDTELWKSDGTEAGTVMVKEIAPGLGGSAPVAIKTFNNEVYFSAHDGVHGYELWKSDGTEAGTVMVKDVYLGPNSSDIPYFFEFAGGLYFSAYTDSGNAELWKTDGTEAGTVKVVSLGSREIASENSFAIVGDTLYFSGYDPTYSNELWKTDGTEAGTVLIKDIATGGSFSDIQRFIVKDSIVYFYANDLIYGGELWKTDGTLGGTVMVKDIYPGGSSNISDMVVLNNVLYFSASDGVYGQELWKSDGTDAGTVMVKNVNGQNYGSAVQYLKIFNDKIYFSADDGIHGAELWQSDGTEGGTMMTMDINDGVNGSELDISIASGDTMYLSFNDGIHGYEVWKMSSSTAGVPNQEGTGQATSSPQNYSSFSSGSGYFVSSTSASILRQPGLVPFEQSHFPVLARINTEADFMVTGSKDGKKYRESLVTKSRNVKNQTATVYIKSLDTSIVMTAEKSIGLDVDHDGTYDASVQFTKMINGAPLFVVRNLLEQKSGNEKTVSFATTTFLFIKNYGTGMKGGGVQELQKFLNTNGFEVSKVGDGSKGKETTFFEEKTRKALADFQEFNFIYPSVGFFGPVTRDFINTFFVK